MILDSLQASVRYDALGPRFAEAFRWLRSVDHRGLPDGRRALAGDELFVLVQRGLGKPREQVKWEAHRRYADIQMVCDGAEAMGWEPLGRTSPGEYDAGRDLLAVDAGEGLTLTVQAGQFAVFFPEDAHRPGILVPGSVPVVKLVVKVLL